MKFDNFHGFYVEDLINLVIFIKFPPFPPLSAPAPPRAPALRKTLLWQWFFNGFEGCWLRKWMEIHIFMNFHEISCFSWKIRNFSVFCRKKRKFSFLAISSLSASPAQKPYKRNAFSCVSGVHWRPFSGKHEKVKKT